MSVIGSVEKAVEDIQKGRMVIVVDEEERENEGDMVMAAEKVTPEDINFIARHARGLICVALEGERLDVLRLGPMVQENTAKMKTPFTVSVDAIHGTTTGISAHDRAVTVKALVEPDTGPEDLARPGHIFPLRAAVGGVLRRAGHTEAAVDLAKLAGLGAAGVLCEIMAEDGSMARIPELKKIAKKFDMKIVSICDLIEYRHLKEKLVRRIAETDFPTKYGEFKLIGYEGTIDGSASIALVKGEPWDEPSALVRVHSQCLTGDVFGSL
ncbi:MAG: 3,4-dihydroxy-2-butanone-4-phosphate synthase, partial [Candidatus Krumholzibacteria bacterium]|nr:3,4-dihydroxy-2-butanone-4-phosphate synthase [Candidatus Krumholzibacteria bacterium]